MSRWGLATLIIAAVAFFIGAVVASGWCWALPGG